MSRVPLGLDVVVARRTPIRWYEGVAIVSGATASLTGAGDNRCVPELAGIFIDADGNVSVRPHRGDAEESAARLARTLHALISSDATPAPLRLLISKWIASTGEGSAEEFGRELAYFARPEPASLVRAVYERCLTMPAVEARPGSPTPAPAAFREKPAPKPRQKHGPLVAAAVTIVSTAAAAGAWVALGSPSGTSARASIGPDMFTSAAEGADASAPTPNPIAGGARSALAAGGNPGRRADVELPSVPSTRSPARSIASPRREPPLTTNASSRGTAPAQMPLSTSVPAWLPVREFATTAAIRSRAEFETGHVYSSADTNIEPPSMLYPSLPPALYKGNGAINSMEVVVSETGEVERVRLVSSPQRMTDMMLLSGAKTWKFAPASLNGEPVRYKMVVTWAATP